MTFSKRSMFGLTATLCLLGAAACSDGQPVLAPADGSAADRQTTPENERIATLVAIGMRDPAVRAQFRAATAASPVKEGKILLNTYLRGQGAALMKAITRAGGATEAELLDLLGKTGPLEIYLPVDEHRAAWKGGDDLIVVTAMKDHVAPFGVDLDGRRVQLSAEEAPATPAISIVPAESFDAQGRPFNRSLAPRGDVRVAPDARLNQNPDGSWTGLWVNEVHTVEDFEGWALGDPEFEFYLQSADTRQTLICAGNESIEPYRFNMDDTNYYADFLIAAENEIPEGTNRVVALYEDDDAVCQIKDDKDYIKLSSDALTNSFDAYKAVKQKQWQTSSFVVHVFNAIIAFKSIVSGNDEFVGVSAGLGDITDTPQTFQLKDQNRQNKGWVVLQRKSDFAQ